MWSLTAGLLTCVDGTAAAVLAGSHWAEVAEAAGRVGGQTAAPLDFAVRLAVAVVTGTPVWLWALNAAVAVATWLGARVAATGGLTAPFPPLEADLCHPQSILAVL